MTDPNDDGIVQHPGYLLWILLKARGITQAALADMMGRPYQVISELVNGKKRLTGRTALELERALGVSARYWLYKQADYDLFVAKQHDAAGTVVKGRATR